MPQPGVRWRFYDLNRQPIICPICSTGYELVPAAPVRTFQGPAKRHVVEADRAEADAVADSRAHPETDEEESVTEVNDAVLIEGIEEDAADVSEIIDAPTEPEEKP